MRDLGEREISNLCRKTMRALQRVPTYHSGEDSGLANFWDEVCVQLQGEESTFWHSYQSLIASVSQKEASKYEHLDLRLMWLRTDAGMDWTIESDEPSEVVPFSEEDIAEEVSARLQSQAADWSNERIRRYLENSY